MHFASVILPLLAAVCAPAAAAAESAETAIVSMEKAALERWTHGDPSGFLEISAPDVVYFDPYLDHRLDGHAALTKLYESLRGEVHAERFELIDPKVQLIGNAAVLTFNFVSWDEKNAADRWNCTEVYRKDTDGWRIVQTHWSLTNIKRRFNLP